MLASSLLVLAAATAASASARTFTVYNGCPFTIWPAMFTSGGTKPNYPTGWVANQYTKVQFTVADDWNGRIWGRRNCDFSGGSTSPNTCATGGCNGGLQCSPTTGTGVPPATLAEFNLNGGTDNYDISAVDGSDLPMSITNNVNCAAPTCTNDINANCPDNLAVKDKNGYVIGCKSSCSANLDGKNGQNSANCCSGTHDTPQTCPSSGVQDYDVCKGPCPAYYCYAYDDKTALKTCPGTSNANYVITFCPAK
ncbi:hypothetical protein RQP46_009564 [Phenoliferia psychrophenolica]